MEVTEVKVLDKALRILALFSGETPVWGASDLADQVGMPKSTVYRVLRVLQKHEILVQDAKAKSFRLGLGALELGYRAHMGLDLHRIALPFLERAATLADETVLLQVLNQDHDRVVCIERVQRQSGLRIILDVGATAPLHAGASSKVLLAFFPPDEIDLVIQRGLPALTANTIINPDRLRNELAEIRRIGYAVSYGETDEGAAGVSAPIRDFRDRVVASLTIAGPAVRMTPESIPRYVDIAKTVADQLSHGLGWRE